MDSPDGERLPKVVSPCSSAMQELRKRPLWAALLVSTDHRQTIDRDSDKIMTGPRTNL